MTDVRLGYKCTSDWEGVINLGCRWITCAWNLQPQAGAQGST